MNDKDDTVKVLENIVKNRELEILDLKKDDSAETTYSCSECDFTSETEKGLKIHKGKKHEHK